MKRITTILMLLMLICMGAGATTYTITYGTATGTFYRNGSASTDWSSKWVSNEAGKPVVTITTSGEVNNMNGANARMAPQTYTIYTEAGYKVTGFAMNCPTFGATVTVTPAGESAVEVAQNGTLVVNSSASSFVFAGGSSSARIQAGSNDEGTFTITVEEDTWVPSFENGTFLTVGGKVSSFTAAASADDNDHWYILTQIRGGESPMYNAATGAQLRRAATSVTLESLNGELTSANEKYLIRFKSVGEGTYNIQFANGYWIGANLEAANSSTVGTYAFYNSNGGSGSYFAWNLNSKSGSRVDNNSAGGTLSFWESGEVSGTTGNNVWYLYETELNVPASTIDVTYAQRVNGVATGSTVVETVLPNSEINIPSSLTSGYSTLAYDISTSGTIAESDVTIYVDINKKAGLVENLGDLSNSKAYTIKCERGVFTVNEGALANTCKASYSINNFAIISYEENYYLWSVEAGKFVQCNGTVLGETPVAITMTGLGHGLYKFQGSGKTLNASAPMTTGGAFDSWSTTDGGNTCVIIEAADFDPTAALAVLEEFFHPSYTVTYIVKDGSDNTLFTSDPVATTNGANITTLPAEYQKTDFYTYNTVDVTISSSGNTNVEFVATPKAEPLVPYTATTSSPIYVNLNIRSKYLVYDDDATGDVTLQETSSPFNPDAAWAFIGEPYAGFKIINQTNGTDKYLTYTSVSVNRPGSCNIGFVDDGDFTNQLWLVDANTGGFCLRMKENTNIYFHHDNNNNYLRTCSVSEWSAVHNDPGSTLTFSSDEDVLLDLYNSMKDYSFGTAIGQYNTTDASVVTNEEAASTITSVGGAIAANTTAAYGACYSALSTIAANIALVTPTAGFYRLKNVATDGYLTATQLSNYSTANKYVYANGNATSAATVIELRTGADGLYMYNQGYGFGWTIANKTNNSKGLGYIAESTEGADKYVNWFPGKAADQIGFAICYGNGTGGYASYLTQGIYTADTSDEAVIAGTDYTADAAQWVVEPATTVTITLNSDGAGTPTYYATGYWPFDVTISGADAYTLALDGTGTWLVPTQLTDNKVPANTPVMLKGSSASATATINTGAAFATSNANSLDGTNLPKTFALSGTPAATAEYFMGIKDNVVGFYHSSVNNADGYYRLGANKAYLQAQVSQGARGYAVMWDESETTGVNEVIGKMSEATDGAVYDLQGRKVANPSRGLYIINGKKVIIK